MISITKHAKKRIRQRCGLSSRSIERLSDKILTVGLSYSDCTGLLKQWMGDTYSIENTANNMRIYGDKVYILREEVLITVLNLPSEYMKTATILQNKKRVKYGKDNIHEQVFIQ